MNDRERFLATMNYQQRDRCPMWDFGFWDETLLRWHAEGLPDEIDDNGKAARFFGMDSEGGGCDIHAELMPAFEPKVIREDADYRWQRRADGVVEKWHKHSTTIPEPTEFLLKGRDTWPDYLRRLDPNAPGRVPPEFTKQLARHRDAERTGPVSIWAGSLYGRLRDWMGVSALSLLLYDDRRLVEEMVEALATSVLATLGSALEIAKKEGVTFDYAAMWEDICFNRGPLISPQMFREICGPWYRRITDLLHSYGVKIVQLDCDGRIDELVPIWLDNGVNCMFPLEVGDWADPLALRKKWGRGMLLRGGFDKHILARGPEAILAEVRRLTPLVEEGAFIPHCDHRVPPDVSLANYVCYIEEAKRVWGRGLANLKPMGKLVAPR